MLQQEARVRVLLLQEQVRLLAQQLVQGQEPLQLVQGQEPLQLARELVQPQELVLELQELPGAPVPRSHVL